MSEPPFLPRIARTPLAEIVALTGAAVAAEADLSLIITGVAPFDQAGPGELTFFDVISPVMPFAAGEAAACFVTPAHVHLVPEPTLTLVVEEPEICFTRALLRLTPQAAPQSSLFATAGISPGASIHPEARLEQNVIIDPGTIIGPRAEIGSGSLIGANSVIGSGVRIGRDCRIGPQVTVAHALIGNGVTLHPGVRIGQPGVYLGRAGLRPGSEGFAGAPKLGRVIIQDHVEIGANATIDRGVIRDTVIGEHTRIGDLARIAGHVAIGRHCTVPAQANLLEGTQLQDDGAA